ncbi:hypothetical protein WN944_019118 [Citrus x changshan-huyou]|uniref:Uncharacterized protein n=1 Tax=Citrus x changshan-huyou TaxID=2935761 RepID=A0AAP0LY07_9ROSI
MLGNEMRNNVELVVTSQELVVEGEPFMLDKDQTENLQVESQSMGKDDHLTNLDEDHSKSDEEEVDKGKTKLKPNLRPENGRKAKQ